MPFTRTHHKNLPKSVNQQSAEVGLNFWDIVVNCGHTAGVTGERKNMNCFRARSQQPSQQERIKSICLRSKHKLSSQSGEKSVSAIQPVWSLRLKTQKSRAFDIKWKSINLHFLQPNTTWASLQTCTKDHLRSMEGIIHLRVCWYRKIIKAKVVWCNPVQSEGNITTQTLNVF